jgi:hypothetical protein
MKNLRVVRTIVDPPVPTLSDMAEDMVARLDHVCNSLHELAAKARRGGWPFELRDALTHVSETIEHLAGSIDSAERRCAMAETAERARELPAQFEKIGEALAADIARLARL